MTWLTPLLICLLLPATAPTSGAPPVVERDLSDVDLSQVVDEEMRIARLMPRLAELANSVVTEGEDSGFIALPLWRPAEVTEPHNARPLENHIVFTWFLTQDRPWNPYLGDDALRRRVELVLERFAAMQLPSGELTEYIPDRPALAPTTFGARFMAETLRMIEEREREIGEPVIDPAIKQDARDALRTAIIVVLSRDHLYDHGRHYSNQWSGIAGAALAYLHVYPDDPRADDIRERLLDRYAASLQDHRSRAGYPYERNGNDWQYSLGTEQVNKRQALTYTGPGEAIYELLLRDERDWADWLSYNAVPAGPLSDDRAVAFWLLNRAHESRKSEPGFVRWTAVLADVIDVAAAFAQTPAEDAADVARHRRDLVDGWPHDKPARVLPGTVITSRRATPTVSEASRREAIASLPYVARDAFTQQRHDGRERLTFTFARRPGDAEGAGHAGYYAAINTGRRVSGQQRYGLGLLWSPAFGVAIQGQTATVGDGQYAYGTRGRDMEDVFEARDVLATFAMETPQDTVQPEAGIRDLSSPDDGNDLFVSYDLEADGGPSGTKQMTLGDGSMTVRVDLPGAIREAVPLLLLEGDEVRVEGRTATVVRPDASARFVVEVLGDNAATFSADGEAVEVGADLPARVKVLTIAADDTLEYRLSFARSPDSSTQG